MGWWRERGGLEGRECKRGTVPEGESIKKRKTEKGKEGK